MGEVGDAYAGCRARIGSLVGSLDATRATTTVPTCPDWSVHDLVAHLTGIVDDVLAGRVEGLATEPWTARQVAARKDRSVGEILAEWNEKAPTFEGFLDAAGDSGRQGVADIASHEHDIRLALGEPGAHDSDAVRIGFGWVARRFIGFAGERGVSLRVRASDGFDVGADDADTTLTGEPFDLLRAMTGRRSLDQLREMGWRGDVERALPLFTWGPFSPPAKRIDE